MISTTFIINPNSGSGRKKKVEKAIYRYLDKTKFDFEIVYLDYQGHSTDIAQKAVEQNRNLVVVVGGDGSINAVGKVLVNTNVCLGIIPAGSGNGLARCLRIPIKRKKAIEILNQYKIAPIDTVSANEHFFVSIAGFGFDARVAERFEGSFIRGFKAYLTIILQEFFTYKSQPYRLVLPGEIKHVKAFMICIANGNQFGFDKKIAPHAQINDGFFDVCVIQKPTIWYIPKMAYQFVRNKIDKSKHTQFFKVNRLTVLTDKKQMMNIDGEAVPVDKQIDIAINPGSLNVIIP